MQPVRMVAIINGHLYNTEEATLLAHDDGWEEQTLEQPGQCRYLYRTPEGEYFVQRCIAWQVERDQLQPLWVWEAARLYQELQVHLVSFQAAFPDLEPETTATLAATRQRRA